MDTVPRDLGPVDLMVSNAGLRERAPAPPWQADPDDWWRVVEANLRGPFLLAHAVLPAMVARGSGRVLHLGSGMAHTPRPEWSAYGTFEGRPRPPHRHPRGRASRAPASWCSR